MDGPLTDIVRIYRFEVAFDRDGKTDTVNVVGPRIARFLINPTGSSGVVLRDVMFLDETDVLVVGSMEGIFLMFSF